MIQQQLSNDRSSTEIKVRTSKRDGRKYVNSNDLIRTEKAQKQIKRLQEMFGSKRV